MKVVQKPGPAAEPLKVFLKGVDKIVGKVGWFSSAKYPDGTPVAYVATIHEYGDPPHGIPPRPFMRTTISEKKQEWAKLAESGAKAILAGNETPNTMMEKIVLKASGDVRKTITLIQQPPLKESTIAARRSKLANSKTVGSLTKPLVETGTLLNTVTGVVENK